MKLHLAITIAALILFHHSKARFPSAWGLLGHHLFISAYMMPSKIICDGTSSNKLWSTVAQEIYVAGGLQSFGLGADCWWSLLSTLEKMIRQNFKETKSLYPNYPTIPVSRQVLPLHSCLVIQQLLNSFGLKVSPPPQNSLHPGTPMVFDLFINALAWEADAWMSSSGSTAPMRGYAAVPVCACSVHYCCSLTSCPRLSPQAAMLKSFEYVDLC